jgi:FKBP-type peptidyl-prolyl cis-trans isomerase
MRFRNLVLLSLAALVGGCALADSTQPTLPTDVTFDPSLGIDLSTYTRVDSNLYYKDIVVGTGATATLNKFITAYYTGWLTNGTKFDSNVGGDSIRVQLNYANVITGWVVGIQGMKEGGTRRLVIGSRYGYGGVKQVSEGKPDIPEHSTLVFEVQLKRVQ